MKSVLVVVGLALCLTVGFVIADQQSAGAEQTSIELVQPAEAAPATPTVEPGTYLEIFAKKCSFDSDCPHGKCRSGKCGGCSFDSDCKGWGKCRSGQCGGCSFDSDCKGFGKCSSSKCTKSPY